MKEEKPVSRVHKEIADLTKAGISISGSIYEESDDYVAIQIGNTLYEIPRHHITGIVEGGVKDGKKAVTVALTDDAKFIQKTVVTAAEFANAGIINIGYVEDECHRRCPMCPERCDNIYQEIERTVPVFRKILR
jgi:hypothetical protein